MLIPSYKSIAPSLKTIFDLKNSDPVARNITLLYLSQWDFDEDWYLSSYPDLANALPSKDFATGFAHFHLAGYFEGRLPVRPEVDASWYMTNYPDVAAAILKGTFDSPAQHFLASGYNEGRLAEEPDIDVSWYAASYLPATEASAAGLPECIAHFKSTGYVAGALPRLKKWKP